MQPKVSMVIPVYNKIEYIEYTLQSIYGQLWNNLELIFVNDGATDGTREKLEEWRPKFQIRGYEVRILDQQNQGVNAAVLAGLKQISGEYVCCVDCDDELFPDYISAMAEVLEQQPRYEWVCCDFEEEQGTEADRCCAPPRFHPSRPDEPHYLEKYLLLRAYTYSWIFLIRTSYLRQCRVIENFSTQPVATQEPSLLVPLAAGGGALRFLPRVLYRHAMWGKLNDQAVHYKKDFPNYAKNYSILVKKAILSLALPEEPEKRLLALQSVGAGKLRDFFLIGEEYTLSEAQAAANISELFFAIRLLPKDILKRGVGALYKAAEARLCSLWGAGDARRIIGYGCLGKRALQLLPGLEKAGYSLSLLWDIAAKESSELYGRPVTQPDLSLLKEGDVVFVFPKVKAVYDSFCSNLQLTGKGTIRTIHPDDVVMLESFSVYPELKETPLFISPLE